MTPPSRNEVSSRFRSMRENTVPRRSLMDRLSDSPTTPSRPIELQSFYRLPTKHPDRCFFILLMSRPGASHFLVDLEMSLFPPSTAKNDLFQVVSAAWEEMDWLILYFPTEYRRQATDIAARWKLRLREDGAIPRVITTGSRGQPGTHASFPIQEAANVYTIENVAPEGRPAFRTLEEYIRHASSADSDFPEFIAWDCAMRVTWANSLPLIHVRVLDADDPAARGTKTCNVCHKVLEIGDTVALVGEDAAKGLATEVCIGHIDRNGGTRR